MIVEERWITFEEFACTIINKTGIFAPIAKRVEEWWIRSEVEWLNSWSCVESASVLSTGELPPHFRVLFDLKPERQCTVREVVSLDETHDSDETIIGITSPTPLADKTHDSNGITSPTPFADETHGSNGVTSPTPLDDETHDGNESEELVQTPALGMTFRS